MCITKFERDESMGRLFSRGSKSFEHSAKKEKKNVKKSI